MDNLEKEAVSIDVEAADLLDIKNLGRSLVPCRCTRRWDPACQRFDQIPRSLGAQLLRTLCARVPRPSVSTTA